MLLVAALLLASARGSAMDDFLGWCAQQGVVLSQHVDVRAGPVRGLVAIRAIARHDLLSATPTRTMLNIEHALADPDLGPAFGRLRGVSELIVLGAYLAYLRHTGTSRWQPHIAVLPRRIRLPHSYSDDEHAQLQASPVAEVARRRRQELDAVCMHDTLHSPVSAAAGARCDTQRAPARACRQLVAEPVRTSWLDTAAEGCRAAVTWGVSVLRSRAYGIRVRDEHGGWQQAMVLAPLVDLYNMAESNDTVRGASTAHLTPAR